MVNVIMMDTNGNYVWGIRQVLVTVIVVACNGLVGAQTYANADTLLTAVLSGYKTHIRPLNDQSQVMTVHVSLQPAALTEFNFVKETINMAALVSMSWVDEKITWNPALYGNLNELSIPQSMVWVPPIILGNPADSVSLVSQTWMYVLYNSSGYASYEPGQLLEATCPLDVTNWPFDKQSCQLMFAPLGYRATQVVLNAVEVTRLYYVENGEWEIPTTSANSAVMGVTAVALFNFDLKRRPTFLIVNLLLPVIFLMALSVCVFLLPPESGERVGYSITVLLSISVFFTVINDFLPSTSQPMATVAYYIMVNFVISALICFGTMLSLRVYLKPETVPRPSWATVFVRVIMCGCKVNSVGADEKDTDVEQLQYSPGRNQPKNIKFTKRQKEEKSSSPPCAGQELTWRELGEAVDRVLFTVFSLTIVCFTMWFMISMATGA